MTRQEQIKARIAEIKKRLRELAGEEVPEEVKDEAEANAEGTPEAVEEATENVEETVDALVEELTALTEELNTLEAEAEEAAEQAEGEENAEEPKNNEEERSIQRARRQSAAARVLRGAGKVLGTGKETIKMSLEEVRKSAAYVDAYAEYIKTGSDKQVRSLLTDLADGTVPTPTMVDDYIATNWANNPILSRILKTEIKGTAKYPFEYSATAAVAHKEGTDAPAEEELKLGTVTVEPTMLKKWTTITDEVMAMKGEAFMTYILAEIEQRILELADQTAVNAILNSPAVSSETECGVPVLSEAADAGTMYAAQGKLAASALHPVAIMTKNTFFTTFMGMVDTAGQPIYNLVRENGAAVPTIAGMEVLFSSALTDDKVIVGDLDGLIANLPEGYGVKFITDPYSLAEKDLVKVVGRMYAGFGVRRPDFFCVVTLTA